MSLKVSRAKLNVRILEAEETIESLNQKISATEKAKLQLETELDEIQLDFERVHPAAVLSEKRKTLTRLLREKS